jgi:hypothetical protein
VNRHDRRAEASKVKGLVDKGSDVATDGKGVKANVLQTEILGAIQKHMEPSDGLLAVQVLGLTAAGIAVEIGVSDDDFAQGMALYIRQTREQIRKARKALGIDDGSDDQGGPTLVLP